MKPIFGTMSLLILIVALGCGSGGKELDLQPVENIHGLVSVVSPKGQVPPKLIAGVNAEVPRKLTRQLEESGDSIQAVVRVMIGPDSRILGIRTLNTDPTDSELAEQYATALADAAWQWEFSSTERSYVDLTFRFPHSQTR